MRGKRDPGTPGGKTGVWGAEPPILKKKQLKTLIRGKARSTAPWEAAARPKAAMGSHACVLRFHRFSETTPPNSYTPPPLILAGPETSAGWFIDDGVVLFEVWVGSRTERESISSARANPGVLSRKRPVRFV